MTYANTRCLTRGTLVDLARKTMIGTTGKQTAEVLETVNASPERQALLAISDANSRLIRARGRSSLAQRRPTSSPGVWLHVHRLASLV